MQHSEPWRLGWLARTCAALLLSVHASCVLVGYDAAAESLDAGSGPTMPPVETPAEDAVEPDPVELDAGAVAPFIPPDPAVVPDDNSELPGPSIRLDETDAGDVEAPSDAAVPTDAWPSASCAGASALGVCWYLAASAASCAATCSEHGGLNARAPSLVGTSSQGGRLSNCRSVLAALGLPPPQRALRQDEHGLGCHLWSNGETFWLDDPSPRYSASAPGIYPARVSCGCMR